MDEQIENTISSEELDPGSEAEPDFADESKSGGKALLVIPLLLSIFLFVGFTQVESTSKLNARSEYEPEAKSDNKEAPKVNFSALLAAEQFSKNLRDTVYTNENLWLELRIDKQELYIHYRNGKVKTYNVSTGNKNLSKGIESRPGLFAIFLKEEVHLSSQFNNARMNYYMPYNMGIGFHGLPGTGYYGFLGAQPSSHGCIRMRNEDVKVLFGECKIGTLVLCHRGYSARVVAFAPEGFNNDAEFTKDDYMNMLAYNLGGIMEGKYFINPPKRFIIDGTVIPRSGINVVSTENIPAKQILPFSVPKIDIPSDKLTSAGYARTKESLKDIKELEKTEFAGSFGLQTSKTDSTSIASRELGVSPEMIKKYVYNAVGVLPYFPPGR